MQEKKEPDGYKSDISTIKTELAVLKWMVCTAIFGILMLLVKAFI